jgi:tetratricopeptide (TPR) repeat protein
VLAVLALAAGSAAVFWARRHSAASQVPREAGWGQLSKDAEANWYFDKAELFLGFGLLDVGRAKKLLEQALQLDPRFGRARAEHGLLYLVMITTGRSNDRSLLYRAEEEILQGLRDDPTFSYGHAALAGVYIHDGHKERAPSEIEAALKIDPYNAAARHWLAVNQNLSGDINGARKLSKETLARHPRFFPSQMYLGELARQQGDWEESIRHHRKLLEYHPEHIFALQLLARAYMDKGDLPEARRTLARTGPADRASFATRAIEAMLLALEKRPGEATKAMDAEVLKYLELNALWTLAGAEFYALMEDRPRALEWLDRAVRQGDERTEWFARDPALKAIWGEPRFRQIVASTAARRAAAARLTGRGVSRVSRGLTAVRAFRVDPP